MTKTKNQQPVSFAEELEAAQLERPSKPISAPLMKKVQRVHEIKELMAPFEAEIAQIRADVFKEMDKKGVDVLTRKGVEVVSRDKATAENWDKKGLLEQYQEIVIQFISTKVSYRINWKNPFNI